MGPLLLANEVGFVVLRKNDLVRPLDNLIFLLYSFFAMVFKKIETTRKSTYAAEQLLSAIREGTFKVGDQIPPERELAERMGISRPLVREALSALQIAGIIESRAGDGTYVKRSVADAEIENQVLAMLDGEEDPLLVFEARIVLEEGATRVAVVHALKEDIETLERILGQESAAAEEAEYGRYVMADREFHLAVVASSRNPFLEAAIHPLVDVMGRKLWGGIDQLYLFKPQGISQTLEEHRRVLEAIKKKDADGAGKAMRQHLENARDRFLGDRREVSAG